MHVKHANSYPLSYPRSYIQKKTTLESDDGRDFDQLKEEKVHINSLDLDRKQFSEPCLPGECHISSVSCHIRSLVVMAPPNF